MVQQIIRDSERLIKLSERQVLLARPVANDPGCAA
jgi:hypothetical protein